LARLDDIPLQLTQLAKGLKDRFNTVEVVQDLEAKQLRDKINDFVPTLVYSSITLATAIQRSFHNVTRIADTSLA
jgi:hypothetical protein